MRQFFLIELVINVQGWWLEPLRPPRKPGMNLSRFWGQVAITLGVEAILGLWVSGGLRPLSAL